MAAIPHGADTDDSYELVAGMTNANGDSYYRAKQPAPPIDTDYPGPGTVPHESDGSGNDGPADVSPDLSVNTDHDRRLQTSDGTKV